MHAFAPSSLLALMATFSLLASTTALPTRGSTSSIGRRARLARRAPRRVSSPPVLAQADNSSSLEVTATNPVSGKSHSVVINAAALGAGGGGGVSGSTININFNSKNRRQATKLQDSTSRSTGDHSILIDASTSSPSSSGGGIKNSTINLTVISRWIRSLVARPDALAVRADHPVVRRDDSLAVARLPEIASGLKLPASVVNGEPSILGDLPFSTGTPNATLVSPTFPPVASATSLPPITVTITLVPAGPNGAYVDAAGLNSTSAVTNSSVPTVSSRLTNSPAVVLSTSTVLGKAHSVGPSETGSASTVVRFAKHRRSTVVLFSDHH